MQVVGQSCAVCDKRISSVLDATHCPACNSALHGSCVDGSVCPRCTSTLPTSEDFQNAREYPVMPGGKIGISDRHMDLPERCVICNQTDNLSSHSTEAYYSPGWILIGFLLGGLPLVLLYFITRRQFRVDYCMCELHAKQSKKKKLIPLAGFLLAGSLVGIAVTTETFWLMPIALIAFLVSGILVFGMKQFGVSKTAGRYCLSGCGEKFVNSLRV
jgi:hypothetical protein